MDSQKDYVLRTVKERGIRFVQLWFTDVLGIPKAFNITPAELENALGRGDDLRRVGDRRVLPSPRERRPGGARTRRPSRCSPTSRRRPRWHAWCATSSTWTGRRSRGTRATSCAGVLDKARDQGFSFYVAPELEYFYFAQTANAEGQPPVPLDKGSYFELMGNNEATALRRETVLMLEEMGIPVEYSQHEDAPSQHEIDLRYTDAMTMADTVMLVRVVVKEMAARKGILATFMPKPLGGVQGSGMHTHCLLFDGDTNAFYDDSDEYHLSTVARQFMAGVLHHASEITAITNQWVNSYKRLIVSQEDQPLIEAPVYISWAQNNRSALVRVPPTKKGKRDSTRSSTARRTRAPTPTWRGPSSWRPASPASAATTNYRQRLQPTSTRCPPRSASQKGSNHCRRRSTTRSMPWKPPSWSRRRSASTCSNGSCATSVRSGRRTRPKSPRSSSAVTSRRSNVGPERRYVVGATAGFP